MISQIWGNLFCSSIIIQSSNLKIRKINILISSTWVSIQSPKLRIRKINIVALSTFEHRLVDYELNMQFIFHFE